MPLQLLEALVWLAIATYDHPMMQVPRYMPLHEPALCQCPFGAFKGGFSEGEANDLQVGKMAASLQEDPLSFGIV